MGATTLIAIPQAGSHGWITSQRFIEKRDQLFDDRFGSLFWQQMAAGYVKSPHVVRPAAPDIGRCQRAGLHPAGNEPFIRPEHHHGTSKLMSGCPVCRIVINIHVIGGSIVLDDRMAHRRLAKRIAVSGDGRGMELLDPTGHLVQRGIQKGIRIGGQHALGQITRLGEKKPVKGSLGKVPVDGRPYVKRRHDSQRTIRADVVRMIEREPIADARAPVMSDDGKAIVPERVHHGDEFLADRSFVPRPGVQNPALSVARQIGCDHRVALRQRWRDVVPGHMTLRIAMQQQDWRPLSANHAREVHAWRQLIER